MTHQRRSKSSSGTNVSFTGDTTVTKKKDQFLANRQNKKNCETRHASGDADLLIVQKAVQSATCCNTVPVGDDTDILVLICYHASLASHDLFFCTETKTNTKQPRIWYIKAVKQLLGPDICQDIIFLHAVLGCDTTSRLHGTEKGASLKKY